MERADVLPAPDTHGDDAHGGAPTPPPNDTDDTASPLAIPAIASAAAAILHGAAAGAHADHTTLARAFVALAVLQGAAAVLGVVRSRLAASALVAVNLVAVAGWIATRLTGFPSISGLEQAARPELADSIAAAFAAVAVVGAVVAVEGTSRRVPVRAVGNAALLAGLLLVPALVASISHRHDHGSGTDGHDHGTSAAAATGAAGSTGDDHAHDDGHDHGAGGAGDAGGGSGIPSGGDIDAALGQLIGEQAGDGHDHGWPRPWDPAGPIDFSGVDGVSAAQQARAEQLVRDTLVELPRFADVDAVGALGYRSIGDADTGFEHFVNYELIGDDVILDPSQPESLVFRVDGDARTLVSAMFIAGDRPIDDPELVEFGGPLMQWHVHDNLCWGLGEDGRPTVVGVLEAPGDQCPPGSINAGAENPMVHVWIAPHECGPFAALEGHGAGQVDPTSGTRADQCEHDHAHGAGDDGGGRPYDPTQPIDLGGMSGVTPEQQAFAENLVAATLRDLPQWADPAVAEAAGFRSIRDGATGHEHYIQWDWIDDDVFLDPDQPESLVYRPRADGTKELVSAMYMLPSSYSLDDVPDWGGGLMQWHVHGDLCFTDDPAAPTVAGTKAIGDSCRPPLVDGPLAPIIHVWIVPNQCGPFAALEGIAGGQVPEGEEILCDHAHGSH
jgi:hypothetical protein